MNVFLFYTREEDGRTRRGNRRGIRRGRRGTRKRKKRKEKKKKEVGKDEEIRIGLSNKRYVSSCIIEDTSLTFY